MDQHTPTEPELLRRLRAMRASIRVRLLLFGLAAVIAGGLAALLTVVTLDWLLWLPGVLRVVVGALFLAGFLGASWYWVIAPLRVPITIESIAGRLERHFGNLQDRLISTVEFLQRDSGASEVLTQRVIDNTQRQMREVRLESALTAKPLMRAGGLCAVALLLSGTLIGVAPAWARTGFFRYADPFGALEWPRTVTIAAMTRDQMVAVGESASVVMRVTKGLAPQLRGVVHLEGDDGTHTQLAMHQDEDGVFSATIDAITTDLRYWFEAGDDDTQRHAAMIRAVKRPGVIEALATVHPPAYAVDRGIHSAARSARVQDLRQGPVSCTIGGSVEITVHSSKPIASDRAAEVGLRLDSGGLIPLTPVDSTRQHLRAVLDVKEDIHFRIALRDDAGFENHGSTEHTIMATPDTPPTVTIVEPTSVSELTPRGVLPLSIRVGDDLGVTSLVLEAEQAGSADATIIDLTARLADTAPSNRIEMLADYAWAIESLGLVPGDHLFYTAAARDNCTTDDPAGQIGRSATMQVRIISDVEFEMRLRDDIAILEARVRETMLEQSALRDETQPLLRAPTAETALTPLERELTTSIAGRESRVARRLVDLGRRFDGLLARMKRNRSTDEQSREQISQLAEGLRNLAERAVPSIIEHLRDARNAPQSAPQQENLQDAAQQQDEVIDRLAAMLRSMAEWGNFRALLTKTRDLLERQGNLRRDTVRFGKTTLGRPVSSLREDEAAALARLRRRQEQLAADAAQLFERMQRLTDTDDQKDPSGRQAAAEALRAARAHAVSRHLNDAAGAVSANRTAFAVIQQKNAEKGLRKTLAALQQREQRELERLSKRLQQIDELIAELLAQQEDLRAATHELGLMNATEQDAFRELARQQRLVRRNAMMLADELSGTQRVAGAARRLRMAGRPMGLAVERLTAGEAEPSTVSQDEAISLLREALERLREIARDTENEALRLTLNQIHARLTEALEAQLAVNLDVESLREAVENRGRVGRSEAREASRLSKSQGEVYVRIDDLKPELEKVVVYEWALQRVAEWMEESRLRLDRRDIDATLVSTTRRIAEELRKLIEAIVETQEMPLVTEFADAEGSGGGQGKASPSASIPAVAELLVLKRLQLDINTRTAELSEGFDASDASEKQLQELTRIGEDQAEVQRLTELLTGRAEGH